MGGLRHQSSHSALNIPKVNINEEYGILHSISSDDENDEFEPKLRDDPDIPLTETGDVRRSFPFVRSIDFTKPIDTRIRTSIRGSQDFESIDKLKVIKKPVNSYQNTKFARKRTIGEFLD